MSNSLNTQDEVYDFFLDESLVVDMIGDRYYLIKHPYHLILDDFEDSEGVCHCTVVSCNIPYIKYDSEKATELMVTAITTLGVEEHKLN